MASFARFAQLMARITASPHSADWRGKWQSACECLWDAFEVAPNDHLIDANLLDAFIRLLSESDRFALARLVIPALREAAPGEHRHPQQQQVIQSTQAQRLQQSTLESTTQADFDDVLYVAEKRERVAAELHVARVMLHDSGLFGSDREDDIEEWLGKHPDLVTKEQERRER